MFLWSWALLLVSGYTNTAKRKPQLEVDLGNMGSWARRSNIVKYKYKTGRKYKVILFPFLQVFVCTGDRVEEPALAAWVSPALACCRQRRSRSAGEQQELGGDTALRGTTGQMSPLEGATWAQERERRQLQTLIQAWLKRNLSPDLPDTDNQGLLLVRKDSNEVKISKQEL